VKVNPEVWTMAKIRAIELGIELSEFLEQAIQKHLETTKPKGGAARRLEASSIEAKEVAE